MAPDTRALATRGAAPAKSPASPSSCASAMRLSMYDNGKFETTAYCAAAAAAAAILPFLGVVVVRV